jgi:GT2 family glycosyltransferase
MNRLFVVLTCHNRRDLTVRAIAAASVAAAAADAEIRYFVYDDGSSDDTRVALAGLSADITIKTGDGTAYWAKGMAEAEKLVLGSESTDDSDFIVWLNDDVVVDPDSFRRLLHEQSFTPNGVIVGAMRDPLTSETTYSGFVRSRWHPLSFTTVLPSAHPKKIATFNGNLVMVPMGVARLLEGIDGAFSHALADIDYGLRCQALGIPVSLGGSTFGTCSFNPPPPPRPFKKSWIAFTGPKGGGNYRSIKHFVKRHEPNKWPASAAVTYAMWFVRQIRTTALSREKS